MIKYAKITNEQTGFCEVGLGTNTVFYESIGMKELDVQQSDIDNNWYLTELCPMKTDEQKNIEEKERIQELSMTRSDFFDGTIKAFGADADDLLVAVQTVLTNLPMNEIEKKVAINNYKNALNFYRKHPLFTMLSDVQIPVAEGVVITITAEQWDAFFDETDKDNPYAYTYLLPPQPVEPPVEEPENEGTEDTTEPIEPEQPTEGDEQQEPTDVQI